MNGLSDVEKKMLSRLIANLSSFASKNARQWSYYDGEAGIKNLGIAIPEAMANVEAVVGWPEIVVDALAERLEWRGWRSEGAGTFGLDYVFNENQLDVEVSKAILDSLVTGVGFLAVTAGGSDEPHVIIDAVPSTQATYVWDERLNRMAYGLVSRSGTDGKRTQALYTPDETITLVDGEVTGRFVHNRGRCGLVALANRARAGSVRGQSEITKAIRYYTDHGVRTILGMEYNREFYTTPQRYLLNVTPDQLGLDEDPTDREIVELGWKVAQNKALIVPPGEPEDGEAGKPAAGQFNAAAPTPYIDELKMLAQLVSAQSGVPSNQLGFVHENPPSADAIRAQESRLVKKAEMRQVSFGQALRNDLAYVCLAILAGDSFTPEMGNQFVAGLSLVWREASTPTLAATVDAMVKLAQAKVFPETSEVIWDRVGVTEAEKKILRRELAEQRATRRLAAVTSVRQAQGADPVAGEVPLDEYVQGSDSSGV